VIVYRLHPLDGIKIERDEVVQGNGGVPGTLAGDIDGSRFPVDKGIAGDLVMGMSMDYPPFPGARDIAGIMDQVKLVSSICEGRMLLCTKEDRIVVSPDEYLSPVQLTDPSAWTPPDAKIAQVVDNIVMSHHAVPPLHQVTVHLV